MHTVFRPYVCVDASPDPISVQTFYHTRCICALWGRCALSYVPWAWKNDGNLCHNRCTCVALTPDVCYDASSDCVWTMTQSRRCRRDANARIDSVVRCVVPGWAWCVCSVCSGSIGTSAWQMPLPHSTLVLVICSFGVLVFGSASRAAVAGDSRDRRIGWRRRVTLVSPQFLQCLRWGRSLTALCGRWNRWCATVAGSNLNICLVRNGRWSERQALHSCTRQIRIVDTLAR